MAHRYYTYLHIDKENKPIYVGKGTKRRAYQQRDYGEEYTVKIVHDKIPELQALEFEQFLIKEIGIDNLYNKYKKGNVSSNFIAIDYSSYKKEVKRISQLPASEIHRYCNLLIDDVIAGDNKALLFFIKKCPLDILLKIKELLYKNPIFWGNV
jgi:hypothetical protein